MGHKQPAGFDAKAFLTKAGTGRSTSSYRKKQVVFAQGDPADAVFYLERGQVKPWCRSGGSRRSSLCSDAVTSLVKGVSPASPFGWPPPRR